MKRQVIAVFLSLILTLSVSFMFSMRDALSQEEAGDEKCLSPYFFVIGEDSSTDRLPLKSTSAEVNIAGVIADVIVTQVYKNEGKVPIEALYIFPGSTRAAVYGMKMTIGERTIVAKIQEREKARQEYEEAKQQGKSASLLEQQRPNVFQMNVANILPGDLITVELKYTELLIPTKGIYEFVYPAVVGPRYSNQPAQGASHQDKWIENPYLHEGEKPPYTFDLKVNIATGLAIQEISCSTHKTDIQYEGSASAAIKLDPSETAGGNRDFILKYRLAGGKIESGLLLFEGEKENFFLYMVQPPERVKLTQIPPREYIFIVDVSGSMHGFPLEISRKLLKDLIGNLRPTDTFNVLLFAGGSSVMSERSLPATPTNIQQAIALIDNERGGGGTELLPALKKALSLPRTEGSSRSVVIATDGYVAVEAAAFDLIRQNLGNANMFAFGIGSSVNRHLIEGMARVGMGEPFIVTQPDEAEKKAKEFRELIERPVLTTIKANFGTFASYDVEPPAIPDLLAERPVLIFGKWRGKPEGSITLEGITGEEKYQKKTDVSKVQPNQKNAALRYLWARHKIALHSDYNTLSENDERKKEVTQLGLTYNLLTAYTSFIAIDSQVRVKDGKATTVQQPLPLPQGVSDYAVGNQIRFQRSGVYAPQSQQGKSAYLYKKEDGIVSEELKMLAPDEKKQENEILHARSLKLDKVEVKGGLGKKSVRQLINNNLQNINQCVQGCSYIDPNVAKAISFTLEVDSQGSVKRSELDRPANLPEEIKECILKALKKLTFPVSKEGRNSVITISFKMS